MHLANTAAVKQYDGLKHSGDFSDARHLARLLRLGILPVGYIYPREERAVRDLLRKRSQLVRQRCTQILSIENLMARNLGSRATGNAIKRWEPENIDAMELLDEQKQALKGERGLSTSVFVDGFEQDWLFGAHGGRVHQELPMHINERSRHPEQAPSARAQPDVQARVGRAQPGARCVGSCRRAGGRHQFEPAVRMAPDAPERARAAPDADADGFLADAAARHP